MRQAKWETLPDDVRAVHDRFEAWRQSRSNRSRVPAALWIAATALARRHGVHRVARALGLNDTALKQRTFAVAPRDSQSELLEPPPANLNPVATPALEQPAAGADPVATDHTVSPPARPGTPAFIQLPWPALAASPTPPCCVVELLHPDGNRMTITLHDSSGHGAANPAPPSVFCSLDLAALARAFWSERA